MTLDHPVEVAPARERELQPDPKAMQRRITAPDEAHRRRRRAQAPILVLVLTRPQRDVVAEPLRLLVRVRMAADVDEQRRVVDRRTLRLVETEPVG